MSTDRKRQARRTAALGILVALTTVLLWAPLSHAQAKPTTVFGCKKEFRRGSPNWVKNRSACFKRLKLEKPGIRCKYPIESRANVDGSRSGDTKDFITELIFHSTDEVEFGEPVRVQLKVTILNPAHVKRICPRALIGDIVRGSEAPHPGLPIIKYYVPIPPNGGLSPIITIKRGEAVAPHAYAELRQP
jgi:hypothetical protein